jgi:PAS domain S-box-containing protein
MPNVRENVCCQAGPACPADTSTVADQPFLLEAEGLELAPFQGVSLGAGENHHVCLEVFQKADVPLAICDAEGHLQEVNPAFQGLLGYGTEEHLHRALSEWVEGEDRPKWECLWRHMAGGEGGRKETEIRFRNRAGGARVCRVAATRLESADGRQAKVLLALDDLSEWRRAAAERARLEAQLIQAQKMELLGTLAGGIAHDFNNLLSVVMGFASIVRARMTQTDPLQEPMKMIEQSARRAGELAQQLLGMARKEKSNPSIVNASEILNRVTKLAARDRDTGKIPRGFHWRGSRKTGAGAAEPVHQCPRRHARGG